MTALRRAQPERVLTVCAGRGRKVEVSGRMYRDGQGEI